MYFFDSDSNIIKYDYQNHSTLYENFTSVGWYKKGIFGVYNNKFIKTDFNINEQYAINIDDISIKDKKSFSVNGILRKIFINSHNEIIFFDLNNYSIRKIERNVINVSEASKNGYTFKTNHTDDSTDIAFTGGTVVAAVFDKKTNVLKDIKSVDFNGQKYIEFNFNNDKTTTYAKIFWINKNNYTPVSNVKTIE